MANRQVRKATLRSKPPQYVTGSFAPSTNDFAMMFGHVRYVPPHLPNDDPKGCLLLLISLGRSNPPRCCSLTKLRTGSAATLDWRARIEDRNMFLWCPFGGTVVAGGGTVLVSYLQSPTTEE